MATGVSGIPNLPDIPTLRNFGGKILHSSQYDDGEAWKGKNVLVIGTGNSGHDIAQDLYSSGAKVTLVQRNSTLIVNIEPSAQLPYALYDEGPSLEDCDLITTSIPLPLARKNHILLTERAKNLDRELLDALERVGFKLDFGEDGTGWQFKYLTRGGGYYFNVGCSDLIVEGEIGLVQFSDIAAFVAAGARMRTGDTLAADLIVLDKLFTYEPVALTLARNDDDFRLVVDRALSSTFKSDDFRDVYAKWFGAPDEAVTAFFRQSAMPE
jgi:putative flavoprotein involved in K+ transport